MTTPAVLYDHVPVKELDKKLAEDEAKSIQTGLSSSFRSYFVSRMVHQVSAPPEHTDETRMEQKPAQSQERQTTSEEEADDDKSSCSAMETIWEDNVCTEYVMVPQSALDQSREGNTAISTQSSKLSRIRDSFFGIFAASPDDNVSWTRRKMRALSAENGILQSVVLDPLVFLSSYIFSHARPLPSTTRGGGWTSETVVDGNRLILPGDVIVMDPSIDIIPENDEAGGTLIVPPGMSESSVDPAAASASESSSCPRSWWHSSTVMVSAHDILAMERQKQRDQDTSLQTVTEEGQAAPTALTSTRQYGTNVPDATVTPVVVHTWTRALWKFAKRRTKYWYRHSYVRVLNTVHQVGKVLIPTSSTTIRLSDESGQSTSEQPANGPNDSDQGNVAETAVESEEKEERRGDSMILSPNAIEMTSLKRESKSVE